MQIWQNMAEQKQHVSEDLNLNITGISSQIQADETFDVF